MWLFIVIIFISSTNTQKSVQDCLELKYRSAESDFKGSFKKFTEDVKGFFRFNARRIEERRQRIKNAFITFIDEAFNDESKLQHTTHVPVTLHYSSVPTAIESYKQSFEEQKIDFENLVQLHGYKAETHTVITTDGYILTLHRILSKLKNESASKSEVVLLHHGLLGSSDDWVLLGPDKALPYLLVDADYDVWLTNARGNKYSKGHVSTTVSKEEYWNFSFHEIGHFDLAAAIDYLRDGNDINMNLQFIGHSLGATALLVLLSVFPQYNHVLKAAILLAPLAYMYGVKGPLRIIADFYSKNSYLSENYLGNHEFIPSLAYPRKFVNKFCHEDKMLCLNPLLLFANGGQRIPNQTLRANILNHVPAGGSMKTFIHYIQLVISGQFRMFDMGKTKNMKGYGTEHPPIYYLSDVTIPVVLFSSSDDWLATVPDIRSLLPNLPNIVMHHVIKRNDFSHTDFVWAEDADVLVYYLLLDVLKQLSYRKNSYGV